MKLFETNNIKIVKYSQSIFNFVICSIQTAQKSEKLLRNLMMFYGIYNYGM